MSRRTLAAALLAAAVTLTACGDDSPGGGTGGVSVVATTTQVGDMARNVAGTRASVSTILEAGADPHGFEPKPSDAEDLAGAALVLRSGGDLDEWLSDVLQNAGGEADTVTLIDAVPDKRAGGHSHEGEADHEAARHDKDEVDPHWWQDPVNAVAAVKRIRDALIAADGEGRAEYTRNAARYVAQIEATDAAIGRCMRDVPAARRKLVTDHDALGSFAGHYDIEVVGTVLPALSTQAQASAGEIARLVRTIRREKVTTVFPETGSNRSLQSAVAREAGVRVGAALYSDSLGPEGSPGGTYLGSLKDNARSMLSAFGAGDCRL